MAVSHIRNATLLQFLRCFKAQTLIFRDRFKRKPKSFEHTSKTRRTQTQHFSLRSQDEHIGRSIPNLLLQFNECSLFWSADYLLGPNPQKEVTRRKFGPLGGHSVSLTYVLSSPTVLWEKGSTCNIRKTLKLEHNISLVQFTLPWAESEHNKCLGYIRVLPLI